MTLFFFIGLGDVCIMMRCHILIHFLFVFWKVETCAMEGIQIWISLLHEVHDLVLGLLVHVELVARQFGPNAVALCDVVSCLLVCMVAQKVVVKGQVFVSFGILIDEFEVDGMFTQPY